MEDNSQIITNFEQVLKKSVKRIPLALYGQNQNNAQLFHSQTFCSAQDVILNVNQQIKAIQKADTAVARKPDRKALERYTRSSFLSVSMLPDAEVPNQNPANRFETQCVSDTQLIDIIDKAEAIANSNDGITQEFDKTFCDVDDKESDVGENKKVHAALNVNNENLDVNHKKLLRNTLTEPNEDKSAIYDRQNVEIARRHAQSEICDKITQGNGCFTQDGNTQFYCKVLQSDTNVCKDNNYLSNITIEEAISPSPVFQVNKSKSPSPLVFDLGTFENFERIALPIIEENPDLTSAKQLINSQIVGKELFIGVNMKRLNTQTSPVLKINTEKLKIERTPDANMDLNANSNKDEIPMQQNRESNDTFLKDEILFSSDEEDNYIHKELQDIPLTCALETSFYEQPDILDKTMYVGFQTASNKSIQIATDSFTKAKSLLDDVEKDVASSTSLTALVDSLSSKHNHSKSWQKSLKNTDIRLKFENEDTVNSINKDADNSTSNNEILSSLGDNCEGKEKDILKRPEKRKFDGFLTASHKKIKLSDIALARCKRVFQDIDLEEDFQDAEAISIEHNENNNEVEYSHIDDDILHEFSRDMSLVEEENNEIPRFIGFKTASKKDINISEAALAKTKNIFDNIDNTDSFDEDFNKPSTSKGYCGFKTASRKDISISNAALIKSNYIFKDIIAGEDENKIVHDIHKESNTFVGFNTANNKEIKISKQALLKTKDMFKDIDKEVTVAVKENARKPKVTEPILNVSDLQPPDIKEMNEELCNDLSKVFENEMEIEIESKHFCGFQTANNKPIKISEKALLESKNLFADIDLEINCQDGTSDKLNPVILKKSRTEGNLTSIDAQFSGNKTFGNAPGHKGFQMSFKTATNKPFNISEHDLETSNKIFEDLEDLNKRDNRDKELPFKGFESSPSKFTNDRNAALNKYKTLLKDIDLNHHVDVTNNDVVNFGGFKTASNKQITVTSEALANSKALFKDIDGEDTWTESTKDFNPKTCKDNFPFKGFRTANNRPISVSTEAIAKSKALFQDLDRDDNILRKDNQNNDEGDVPIFKGFQTDNNKLISVGEEALAKSKLILKEIDCEDILSRKNSDLANASHKITFKRFQTASNKIIDVSNEALARSKLLFKDIDNEEVKYENNDKLSNKHSVNMFQGFQTANKKPVSISAAALARSKALFKDLEQDFNSNTPKSNEETVFILEGFRTANQKPVTVSAQAFATSKAVFKDIDNDINDNIDKFKGFQTASNKTVNVSEEAMLKSKKIFEDMDRFKENDVISHKFKGFQTASNKKVKISDQALKRTRQIFQDIDLSDNSNEYDFAATKGDNENAVGIKAAKGSDVVISKERILESNMKLKESQEKHLIDEKIKYVQNTNFIVNPQNTNIDKLIDTQIINDFEATLCTEDFSKDTTPRQSKRSGSPILSCPRAKKRKKFETPYKNDGKSSVNEVKSTHIKSERAMMFGNDYKKIKRFKLKDLSKVEERSKKVFIDPYILNFSLDTILDFEFSGKRNDITDGKVTVEDLKGFFEKAVNKKLIPIGWIENHVKLIIWKLISYEIRFPNTLCGVCKAKNVLEQLKYRFDRELYNAERPALRKILEKDDVPSKIMVLCVAGILVDGASVESVTNISSNVELLLSDGWYCVKTTIDKMLTKLVYDGKITVGSKIVTTGAELINCEQGVSPWEDTSSVRLRICGNSTRPGRWDARLGYHSNGAMLSRLSTVKPEGGKVSKLRLFVARVYPMLYVEKFEDGSTVTRSERLEHIYQAKYESERQTAMEKLYEEVEKELSDQESQESYGSQMASKHQRGLSDSRITESQAKSLEDRSHRKRERLLQNVQERVRKKIEEKGLAVGRNLVTLLKVRVAGVDVKDSNVIVTKGLMSIWKPNDMLTEIIKEGAWIEVLNVVPTAVRYSEIHLSAGRQSVFSQSLRQDDVTIPYTQALKRICYPIKDLAQNPTMTTDYNEIDTIGYIFHIDEESNQPFQNIYLSDSEKNIICVNFWGGLKKFGFQNILEVGHIVYGTNLQKRAGNTRKSIPQFRVTEFSYFTKTPKNAVVRNAIEDLEKKFSSLNKKKYCEECVTLKNNFSFKCVTENVSPYRFHNDHNLSKNRVFIDSPLAAKCEDNFNLTGLDFESTFKQDTQELSPKTLERKRMVRQKIAKLKMIGEPPPLSPLNIIYKSKNALNSYKSPLAQTGVANTKSYQNSRIDKDNESSPIIQCDVNKFYQQNVTSVNKSIIDNEKLESSSLVQTNIGHSINKNLSDNIKSSANVASLKNSYQKSRIANNDIQSSPVFSMNRTYVKNVNPVKLNFSNAQDNSLDDVVDQFAEDFDASPPLSLD